MNHHHYHHTSPHQPPSPPPSTTPTPTHGARLICHIFCGRLGNQLFQYASVLGLAHRLGRTPVFVTWPSLLESILQRPPPSPSLAVASQCDKAEYVLEEKCCCFDERLVGLDPAKDYKVDKFLQSWEYFQGAEDRVRTAMTFRKDVLQAARSALQEELGTQTRDNNNNNNNSSATTTLLIGVHVRRGDYLNLAKVGYIVPPTEYYRKAMDYMRTRFGGKNITFLVSVDDRNWFLKEVTSSSDVIVLKRRTPAVDMVLLSSLDHVIISVGTYSWWVGFFNKGVTVYWKDFIAPNTFIGDSYGRSGSSYIYPGWVPL